LFRHIYTSWYKKWNGKKQHSKKIIVKMAVGKKAKQYKK
jgi:hypothetical protein